MSAIPTRIKRERLRSFFRNLKDRFVNLAPTRQAATQPTSQPSRPQDNQRSDSEHQRATPNPTTTFNASINAGQDNDRAETLRASPQDSLWEDALTKLEAGSSTENQSHARALRKFAKAKVASVVGQNGSEASDGNDLIEEVKRAAESKRADAEQKSWKVKVGSRTIVLSDVATRIIDCLNKFKEIGDVAVSYDPVHAALPWAAFRFLLQAATLNKEQTSQLLDGIEKTTQTYLRARIYQRLYLDLPDHQSLTDALKQSLVDLLAAICAFLGLFVKCISSRPVTNATRWILSPDSLDRCTRNITETEAQVEKNALSCKAILDADAQQRQGLQYEKLMGILRAHTHHFDNLQTGLAKVVAGVGQLVEALSDEEANEIFRWISMIPYETDFDNARKGRLGGTCEWLIAHRTYEQWKASSVSTTLWLHGIPGAGKTKLSTKVVDDIAPTDMPLAYFFCDRNQDNRRDPVPVLHSIMRQLARSSGPERIKRCVMDAYKEKKKHSFASNALTDEESRKLLLELANGNSQSTIIIDGLDECNEESRKDILDTLDYLIQQSSSVVKVFVASRNDKDLIRRYSDSPNLEIEPVHNQEDIEKLIHNRISLSPWAANGMSEHVRAEVIRLFREKSQGMFQWASLHINELLELESDHAILAWLKSLPEGLKAAYDRIYDAIGAKQRIYADRAFMWIMAARDARVTLELLRVLVCQDTKKEFDWDAQLSPHSLLSACRNLIKIHSHESMDMYDNSNRSHSAEDEHRHSVLLFRAQYDLVALDTCRFSHLSVQEYLETHRLNLVEAKRMILEISIQFWQRLSATEDQKKRNDQEPMTENMPAEKRRQLQSLTTRIIQDFVSSAEMTSANQIVWDKLLRSTKGQDVVHGSPSWKALHEFNSEGRFLHHALQEYGMDPFATPIGMCAFFGNQAPIKFWIDNKIFDPKADNVTAMGLVFAAWDWQQIAVCNLLLDKGTSFEDYPSPMLGLRLVRLFHRGSKFPQESGSTLIRLLKALIAAGASMEVLPSHRWMYNGTYPLEIAQLLLEHHANPDARDRYEMTPLMHAVVGGDENIEMTKLLLKHGAEVNSKDDRDRTPLRYAARNLNNLETLKLLLDRGANPNAGETKRGTPLQHLANNLSIEAVKLLLDKEAQVNTVSIYYGTALHAAALRGSEGMEIYDLLLSHGADPNIECQLDASHFPYPGRFSAKQILESILMDEKPVSKTENFSISS